MSIFNTSGLKCQYLIQLVNSVNILYKWIKKSIFNTSGEKCQYVIQVVNNVNSLYK
jgi:hypothetical protein